VAGSSKSGSSSGYLRTLFPVTQRMIWPNGASRSMSAMVTGTSEFCKAEIGVGCFDDKDSKEQVRESRVQFKADTCGARSYTRSEVLN
jgi:hypothetical protein